ncbi:MAG TPA: hypothetical protein VK503_02345 [Candidatus Bathyarchaeia archaeon]|nr:hypothetical protein [Candidatus Bathyarchaeia archaeon]
MDIAEVDVTAIIAIVARIKPAKGELKALRVSVMIPLSIQSSRPLRHLSLSEWIVGGGLCLSLFLRLPLTPYAQFSYEQVYIRCERAVFRRECRTALTLSELITRSLSFFGKVIDGHEMRLDDRFVSDSTYGNPIATFPA